MGTFTTFACKNDVGGSSDERGACVGRVKKCREGKKAREIFIGKVIENRARMQEEQKEKVGKYNKGAHNGYQKGQTRDGVRKKR